MCIGIFCYQLFMLNSDSCLPTSEHWSVVVGIVIRWIVPIIEALR